MKIEIKANICSRVDRELMFETITKYESLGYEVRLKVCRNLIRPDDGLTEETLWRGESTEKLVLISRITDVFCGFNKHFIFYITMEKQ